MFDIENEESHQIHLEFTVPKTNFNNLDSKSTNNEDSKCISRSNPAHYCITERRYS